MEKNIKLTMDANKTVSIIVNEEKKYIIPENNRNISADKIYEIINFSIGDSYTVIGENPKKIDEPVLNFFLELFKEIINKINSLDDTNENNVSDDNTESDFRDDIPF
jgi:hypothetical protein